MYIEKLIIKKNEKVVANLSFRKGLNAIANEDYILDVILCVLGKKVAMTLDGNYSFTAKVFVDDKYLISGCKKMGGYFWDVAVLRVIRE